MQRFTEGKSELQWLETFYNVARQRGAKPSRLNCRHLLSSGKPTS
nr:anaerobic dimethyl sulfoxide reductase chain A [uncultured bacterium]